MIRSNINLNNLAQANVFIADAIDGEKAKAKKVIISTGKTQGDFIEITDGLADGNAVIKEGARSVKDGQEVTIITKK